MNLLKKFNDTNYTITSRQAVTNEITFESLPSRCQPPRPEEIPSTTNTESSTIDRMTDSEEGKLILITISSQENTEISSTATVPQVLPTQTSSQASSSSILETTGSGLLAATLPASTIVRVSPSSDSMIFSSLYIAESTSMDRTLNVVSSIEMSTQGAIEPSPTVITEASTIDRITGYEDVNPTRRHTFSQENAEISSMDTAAQVPSLQMTAFSRESSSTMQTVGSQMFAATLIKLQLATMSDSVILSSPYGTESRSDVVEPATASPQATIEPSPTIATRQDTVTSKSYYTMKMMVASTTSINVSVSRMVATPTPAPSSNEDSLEHNLNHVLESLLFTENPNTTTNNLSSILRGVGNQTVELEISEV